MQLSAEEIVRILRRAGWPDWLLVTMTAIGLAESGGISDRVNPGNPRGAEHSVGIWQINMNAHGARYGTETELYDPLTNAQAAYAIYQSQGLNAWSVFTRPANRPRYLEFLDEAQAGYDAATATITDNETEKEEEALIGWPVAATIAAVLLFIL